MSRPVLSRPVLSRRGLVQASAAALGAVGLPAAAAALASPALDMDAGLVAVIRRHGEAIEVLRRAEGEAGRLYGEAMAADPPQPEALRWRPDDFPRTSLGVGLSDPVGYDGARVYGDRAIAWLRDHSAETWFSRVPPLLECVTRWRQIIEAHDAWDAERRVVADRVGYTAAVAAREAACEAASDAEADVMALPVRTVAGLVAKAAWVAECVEEGEGENLVEAFVREVAAFGEVAS